MNYKLMPSPMKHQQYPPDHSYNVPKPMLPELGSQISQQQSYKQRLMEISGKRKMVPYSKKINGIINNNKQNKNRLLNPIGM